MDTPPPPCPPDRVTHPIVRDAPPADVPLIGRCIDGRYTLLAPLGSGAMGSVYRAEQLSLGREVAVKLIGVTGTGSDGRSRALRFLREARLAAQVGPHPNAAAVLDFGCAPDGMRYLVTELIHGRTLSRVVAEDGRFDRDRLASVARQLLSILRAIHEHGIVHRDLKSDNIMLIEHAGAPDLVKLIDFGIARPPRAQPADLLTMAGEVLGTPAYMAPEVIVGAPADERSDLYSLGVILFQLAAGRLPFPASDINAAFAQHLLDDPPDLPHLPPPLASFIHRLLSKNPMRRPPTAEDASEALAAASRR